MYDRSLLSPAKLQFVVIADTHYMRELGAEPVEFPSRRKQTARAETALKLAASLDAAFVVHLGDLVQEYPESDEFAQAMAEARGQLARCGIDPKLVAGNHDVGDKPDPTMPTHPVSQQSLAAFHRDFGRSWYSFDQADCHFIVLNSQILNSTLPEAARQRSWLEEDLAAHGSRRLFLFLHLPPYLMDDQEPALGHYDNVAQPDRRWLMNLVRRYGVEWVLAAHVHCSFFDRLGRTRYLVCQSTSFTRPGFCHMFTSPPPPDHGRDDAPKLGFYLVRVMDEWSDARFLRTAGATEIEVGQSATTKRVITRSPKELRDAPLAVTLRHPLSSVTEIPLAWPSSIRQRVRNDYPLLALLELGAAAVRTPVDDLADPLQSARLKILREEGVRITATALWSDDLDLPALVDSVGSRVDHWELQLPGLTLPDERRMAALRRLREEGLDVSLSTILPNQRVGGKQHPRTRHGFRHDELVRLDSQLIAADESIDGAICRIDADPFAAIHQFADQHAFSRIGRIDFLYEATQRNQRDRTASSAAALLATSLVPGAKLYVEPLVDLDRTMDISHGLLDPLCNPHPMFHGLRCLNSVLQWVFEQHGGRAAFSRSGEPCETPSLSQIGTSRFLLRLLNPAAGADGFTVGDPAIQNAKTSRLFLLDSAEVVDFEPRDVPSFILNQPDHGAMLLLVELT